MQAVCRRADGGLILDGVKLYVHDAMEATDLIVAARLDDGVVLVLVSADAPGVHRRPLTGFATGLAEARLTGVAVAESDIIGGGASDGWAVLERAFTKALPVLSAYQSRRAHEGVRDDPRIQPVATPVRATHRPVSACAGPRHRHREPTWTRRAGRPTRRCGSSTAAASTRRACIRPRRWPARRTTLAATRPTTCTLGSRDAGVRAHAAHEDVANVVPLPGQPALPPQAHRRGALACCLTIASSISPTRAASSADCARGT